MKDEIDCACEFLCPNVRAASGTILSQEQLETFKTVFKKLVVDKYTNHWYPHKPMKGNGFRCIIIDKDTKVVDPIIMNAAEVSDISKDVFLSAFSYGLALWIDPGDVSYRTGHSSNVVSLYKSSTDSNCTSLPVRYQPPVSSNSQHKPVYTNGSLSNGLSRQWKKSSVFTYPQLTNKQLKIILQQSRNIDSFYWTNVSYAPQQVTEVY